MKKLIVSLAALILIAFIFVSCSDNNVTENQSASAPAPGKGTGTINLLCANNIFPDYGDGTGMYSMSYINCSGVEGTIPAKEAALLWGNYVTRPSGTILGSLACNGATPISSISGMTKGTENNHPKLTWNFVYSHYYTVKRKIDNGTWQLVATINNKGVSPQYTYSSTAPFTAQYVDNSITLTSYAHSVSYQVYARFFNVDVFSSSVVTYTAPLVVSVTGTSRVYIPRKGGDPDVATWTATVTGGTPPYTYSWNQPGGSGATCTNTYYYSAGTRDYSTYATCTVTDAAGATASGSYPFVEDYYPYSFEQ